MTVPSYDDLTPGIPDMAESRLAQQLSMWLRDSTPNAATPNAAINAQLPTAKSQLETGASELFACLRTADGGLPPLLAVAKDFSPRIMRVSDCEVLLDVSGLGALIGEPPAIAKELRRAVKDAGAHASVAIGETQTIARLLAMVNTSARPERPGLRGDLAGLPVGLLRTLEVLPRGINHRDRARPYEIFEKWGIVTLGELAGLPPADLSSRLGRRGVALHRLARGLDAAPFVPDGDVPRFIGRLELEWPLDTLEPLSFVFARLLEPLALALERADRGAAAVRLELRLTDRSTHARVLQLPAPMRDPKVLRTLLLLDLESSSPTAAVDIVTIELDPAPARITQFSLLQRALPSPETLSTLTARLSALVGESRIGSPVLLDSHRPDAFEMARYAPAEGAKGAKGADGAKGAAGANGAGATAAALVLRRQRIPPAIRVSVDRGRPVYLASAKRGMPHGAVIQSAGPWRRSGQWWESDPSRRDLPPKGGSHSGGSYSGGSYDRDEWDVALASGAVCRIYQDRTTGCWFLEATYD